MKVTRRTLTIDGLNTTYYCLGTGPTLLFLHGGRLRALTFMPLLRLLAQRYTIIAPDLPGYGASATPRETWSYKDYAVFLEAFLAKLQLKNVVLVGYSMGGGIAGNLAANSRRVKRLVLVDAAGCRSVGRRTKRGRSIGRIFFYLRHPSLWGVFWSMGHDYAKYLWKHRYDHAHMKLVRQSCATTSEQAWGQISVPTLLLWGRDDQIIPLKVGQTLQKCIPGSTLEIVSGNHDWLLYNPVLISIFML